VDEQSEIAAARRTRERIVFMLRRGPRTVGELATALGLTGNAVRAHLTALERDQRVESRPLRGGVGKPAQQYRLSAAAEDALSRAYAPVLAELLSALADRVGAEELERIMLDVGKRLASGRVVTSGEPAARAASAATLLEELGGLIEVEKRDEGVFVLRGFSCPLSQAVERHPKVCRAVEALVSEVAGMSAAECCDREGKPRCRIELRAGGG
jgi:predicted ArsR family transcriptional regulator